jgi:hypothetical protein
MRVFLGFLLGVLGLGAARFAFTPWPDPVHFHANWAVFADGERLDLADDRYMEDVAACGASEAIQPEGRVHMHEGNADVVHVHHDGVTWGHLAQNLGWAMGEEWIELDDGRRLSDNGEHRLTFIVNGFVVPSIRDRPIASGDRVLISYHTGSPDDALALLYPQVADNAAEFNASFDPAGCSGGHGSLPVVERIRRAFWW